MSFATRTASNDRYARFGTVAVELGYISVEILFQAMKIQVDDDIRGKPHRQIGTILYDMKVMNGEQIDTVMKELLRSRMTA